VKYLLDLIVNYIEFQEACLRIMMFIRKPSRSDIQKLAAIAAYLGYKPDDIEKVRKGQL
jgi:preprotein translocase subunit Sss1